MFSRKRLPAGTVPPSRMPTEPPAQNPDTERQAALLEELQQVSFTSGLAFGFALGVVLTTCVALWVLT